MKTNFNIKLDLSDLNDGAILGARVGRATVEVTINVDMDDAVYERAAIRFEKRVAEMLSMFTGAPSPEDESPLP